MIRKIRGQVPLMIGASICLLGIDGIIFLFRLMGIPRDTAIYAGVLVSLFMVSLGIRHHYRSHVETTIEKDEENDHA